jgi:hypothetical protein
VLREPQWHPKTKALHKIQLISTTLGPRIRRQVMGMFRIGQGWHGRRLTACLLIFALFLHGVTFAMAGVRLAPDAAGGADWAGFELCGHDNAAPALPGAPDDQADDTHCVFCIAGLGFVLAPPSTVFCSVEISIAPWPMAVWHLPPAKVDAGSRPRGPPAAA